jgi:misacylated tRNA(Ala) deacylase
MKEDIDPKMHTAEHVLNQTMIRLFNCGRCFSAHIEKKKSKCDYHFNRALTADELIKIENRVNSIIIKDMPVTAEMITLEEAREKYNLDKLPGETPEIRIIRIGDYDAVPCVGNHVKSTKEIGIFKIISSDFKENVLRIRYKLQ